MEFTWCSSNMQVLAMCWVPWSARLFKWSKNAIVTVLVTGASNNDAPILGDQTLIYGWEFYENRAKVSEFTNHRTKTSPNSKISDLHQCIYWMFCVLCLRLLCIWWTPLRCFSLALISIEIFCSFKGRSSGAPWLWVNITNYAFMKAYSLKDRALTCCRP